MLPSPLLFWIFHPPFLFFVFFPAIIFVCLSTGRRCHWKGPTPGYQSLGIVIIPLVALGIVIIPFVAALIRQFELIRQQVKVNHQVSQLAIFFKFVFVEVGACAISLFFLHDLVDDSLKWNSELPFIWDWTIRVCKRLRATPLVCPDRNKPVLLLARREKLPVFIGKMLCSETDSFSDYNVVVGGNLLPEHNSSPKLPVLIMCIKLCCNKQACVLILHVCFATFANLHGISIVIFNLPDKTGIGIALVAPVSVSSSPISILLEWKQAFIWLVVSTTS